MISVSLAASSDYRNPTTLEYEVQSHRRSTGTELTDIDMHIRAYTPRGKAGRAMLSIKATASNTGTAVLVSLRSSGFSP